MYLPVSIALAGTKDERDKTTVPPPVVQKDSITGDKKIQNNPPPLSPEKQEGTENKIPPTAANPLEAEGNQAGKGMDSDKVPSQKDSLVKASMRNENVQATEENPPVQDPPSSPTKLFDQQDSDNTGWISWLALLMSIAAIAYTFINKRNASEDNKKDRRNVASVSRNEFNNLEMRLNAIQRDLQNLSNHVASLKVNAAQQPQQMRQAPSTRPQVHEKPQTTTTLYASMVKDGQFLSMGISSQRTPEAVFIITVNGNDGTYVINDDPQVQARLLATVKYSIGSAAEVETKASPARRIVTTKAGKVTRNGESWKIVDKAYVELK